mmetsp:Transcript_83001/g.268549  ORF Transcript_83001/g.268549 Transcript_83001/m.268549 type:complete len:249 (-) Transcript_83001:1469-2215(-)
MRFGAEGRQSRSSGLFAWRKSAAEAAGLSLVGGLRGQGCRRASCGSSHREAVCSAAGEAGGRAAPGSLRTTLRVPSRPPALCQAARRGRRRRSAGGGDFAAGPGPRELWQRAQHPAHFRSPGLPRPRPAGPAARRAQAKRERLPRPPRGHAPRGHQAWHEQPPEQDLPRQPREDRAADGGLLPGVRRGAGARHWGHLPGCSDQLALLRDLRRHGLRTQVQIPGVPSSHGGSEAHDLHARAVEYMPAGV